MNRSERRRRQKENLLRTMNLQREKNTDTAMVLLLSIPIKVLHEKYGWGEKKRLPEFAEALVNEYYLFQTGKMTLEEYQNYVFEKCGIRFEK